MSNAFSTTPSVVNRIIPPVVAGPLLQMLPALGAGGILYYLTRPKKQTKFEKAMDIARQVNEIAGAAGTIAAGLSVIGAGAINVYRKAKGLPSDEEVKASQEAAAAERAAAEKAEAEAREERREQMMLAILQALAERQAPAPAPARKPKAKAMPVAAPAPVVEAPEVVIDDRFSGQGVDLKARRTRE